MRRLPLLGALLLTSCANPAMYFAGGEEWAAEVAGLTVNYKIVDDASLSGQATWFGGECRIVLSSFYPDRMIFVAAHELAHCLDGAYLRWSANGFRDEGCTWGEHYCTPREGYAHAWARLYMETCGRSRSPLGLIPGDGVECELPSPWAAMPLGKGG